MGPRMILLGAPLLAISCTVGPDYRAPEISVEATYGPAGESPQGAAAVDAAWWRSLNDERLDSLMATATANNLDLQLAQARIREARAQRAVSVGGELPSVGVDAGYRRDRLSQNSAPYNAFDLPNFPWDFNTFQLGFDASWEVDIFGGNRRAIEAETGSVQAAVEDRRAVLVTLQGEVARNYVELRGFQRQRLLARRNLEIQNQTLALTRDRVRNGVGSELDLSRAAALVARTASTIPVFDRGEWQALHRLAVLTHQPLEALAPLHEAGPVPVTPDSVAVGVPAELIRRRPDIRRAERQLAAATARIGEAQADLYPKLSLTGIFNLQSASIEDLLNWRSRSFSFGPSISWPVFQLGRLSAVVDLRDARQQEAFINYEQTVEAAIQEVRDEMVAFSTGRARRASLAEAVAADRDVAELADKLYSKGVGDLLSVLDAQRQLNESEDTLARSDAELAESLIGLYKALGGGWQTESSLTGDPAPSGK